jgi:hypothetical protein
MSDPKTIIKALQDVLQASEYVTGASNAGVDTNNILLGIRLRELDYPCIVLEPDVLNEDDDNCVGDRQSLQFFIKIFAFVKIQDAEKLVAGNDSVKGILDTDNYIKQAISASPNLGLTDIDRIFIISSSYDYEAFPIRGLTITVRVDFRQYYTTR